MDQTSSPDDETIQLNQHQLTCTLGHCSQNSSILMSPTLVWTVTDILSLSETAPSHDGQPVGPESGGWLQNTAKNGGWWSICRVRQQIAVGLVWLARRPARVGQLAPKCCPRTTAPNHSQPWVWVRTSYNLGEHFFETTRKAHQGTDI